MEAINEFSEIQVWAHRVFSTGGPGVERIILTHKYRKVFFRILLDRLEKYLDRLIFGDIDTIYLCCYREGVHGHFTFFFSGNIKGYKVFDYNLGDVWENKDFLRLYLGDIVFEILEEYRAWSLC